MSGNLRYNLRFTVSQMDKGEAAIYHQGHLAVDRAEDPAVDAKAREMLALYDEGLVTLVQVRLGENRYDYIAIKR